MSAARAAVTANLDIAGDQLLSHALAGWLVNLVEGDLWPASIAVNMSTDNERATRMVPFQ